MKKIFSYIVGVIMVLSSVIAISHFVTPSEDKNINAESVEYITLPFDCFYLTTDFYGANDGNKTVLGNAGSELNLSSTHSLKDTQTYAILGLKPTYYKIQNGKYMGKTLLEVLSSNKYIELPTTIDIGSESNAVTKGYIVGISYVVKGDDQKMSGYPYYMTVQGDLVDDNHGAFDKSSIGNTASTDVTKHIKGIRIPKTYTRIGSKAFNNMQNLERVEFQNNDVGSKYFGNNVFANCEKLVSSTVQNSGYVLPNSLTSIPMYTFSGTAITEAYIPNKVVDIDNCAFQNCVSLSNVRFEDDSSVDTISASAFKNCVMLESFVLPSSVTKIEQYAFQNTFSLKKVSIHTGVNSVDKGAFSFSKEEYEAIDDSEDGDGLIYSFDDISNKFTFDSPRTIVFGDTFGSSSLYAVDVKSYSIVEPIFDTDDKDANYTKYNYVYSHDISPVTFTALKTMCNTGTSAYYINHTSLNAEYFIKIDESAYAVSSDLFGSANAVPSTYNIGAKLVVDNNGLSKNSDQYNSFGLDAYNFKGWSMDLYSRDTLKGDTLISTVELDGDITINDQTSIYTDVEIYANYEIKKYSVTINNKVYDESVVHGTALKSVFADSYLYNGDLDPQNLNYVGVYTNSNYTNLVNWEDGVTSDITLYSRNVPFENLYNFKYDADNDGYVIAGLKSNIGAVSQLYIPTTYNAKPIIGIGDRAFINNNKLTKLFFADFDKDSTFTIGTYAFQGCSNLTYAELPASNLTVRANAFVSTGITEITLLGSTTNATRGSYNIDTSALISDCKILKSSCDTTDTNSQAKDIYVTLDIDGTYIYYMLFPHHYVYLPSTNDKITYKKGYYFVDYSCRYNLGYGDLDIESDGLEAGNYCYSWFSEKSTDEGSISEVLFSLNNDCMFGLTDSTTVNGWSDSYIDYVANKCNNDNKYFETVDLPEDANKISDEAFNNDTNIKKVILNCALTQIGESTFNGCVNLREIVFQEGYNQKLAIKNSAFKSCTSLTSFGKISADNFVVVNFFGESVFEDCTNLQYVYLSNVSTFSTLGNFEFKNCKKLLTITIPESVIEIGKGCFENCSALTTVVFTDDSKLSSIQSKVFCNSGITNINFDKTQLKYLRSEAFKNTYNLNSISLVSKADKLYFYGDSNDIFIGSSVREIALPGNIEFNGIKFRGVFNGANELQRVVVATDGDYQNYNDDGIIYHRTGEKITLNDSETDVLAIDYIPYAYTGTLIIPACVTSITTSGSTDSDVVILSSFDCLKNVTEVIGNSNFPADSYKYIVINGDLYYRSGSTYILAFVPNHDFENGVYLVNQITTDIYAYAFNSNTYIKVLSFDDTNVSFGSNHIPCLHSDSIEAVVVPNFITTIIENNFKYMSNLCTIKISDTIEDGGNVLEFENVDAPTNAFDTSSNPVFIVPTEDVDVYISLPNFESQTIRSNLVVVYDTNGGVVLPNTEFEFGDTPTSFPSAVKTGYDFVGWCVDESLMTPYVSGIEYADLKLYARYSIHMYTYTYMVDNESYYTQEVAHNSKASGPETNPSKKGKVFVGWVTADGVDYSLDANNVNSDLILYAKFKTDNKYITKLIIVAVASVVVLGVVITIIVKSVKKKKAYKK